MYGYEDRFLHPIARGTDIFGANKRQQKTWPVHVIDVGRALEIMAYDDSTAGETYELFGPRQYSKEQVAHLVYKMILKEKRHINLPKPIMMMVAKAMDFIWWPTYTPDEIMRMYIDQVIDKNAKTFKDLGIEPSELDTLAYQYIRDYRYVSRMSITDGAYMLTNSPDHPPTTIFRR